MYQPRKFLKGEVIRAADLAAMDAELVRLGRVRVSGGISFQNGPGGLAIGLGAIPPGGTIKAIAAGIIPARVSASEDGAGEAVLWDRTPGTPDLVEGETVTVYNSFNVAIPDGTPIRVAPTPAGDYDLVAADYCPTA